MTGRFSFSPEKRWILFGIMFLLGVYGLILLERSQDGEKGPGSPTTYSIGPNGYKALFLWLRELGVPVKRWERPAGDLDRTFTVLVLLQPETGPDPGEMEGIRNWVRAGGTLVLSSMPAGPYIAFFGIEGAPSPKGAADGEKAVAHGFQPGPYAWGKVVLSRTARQGFTTSRPGVVFHLTDKTGGVIAVVREGKGRVIAAADPFLFTNRLLRQGDHARLLLDLVLTHRGDGAIAIDEYHHGFGRATSVLSYVSRSAILFPLLQGLVLLLFLWAIVGRRFGPPRPVPEGNDRSSMEYVRAMARLFQRGQKREFAFESLVRWVEDEARFHLAHKEERLRKDLDSARLLLKGPMTDAGLLNHTRQLLDSLENARRRSG